MRLLLMTFFNNVMAKEGGHQVQFYICNMMGTSTNATARLATTNEPHAQQFRMKHSISTMDSSAHVLPHACSDFAVG